MLKYIRVLFYFLTPNYKKIMAIYYDDLVYVVKYLQELYIGEKVKFDTFLRNVSLVSTVGRINDCTVYKIAIYKKWDLKKEFLPTDIAWILVDGNNYLQFISFDKHLFYRLLANKLVEHAQNNYCSITE
jgi:hypothetical protein